MFSSILLIVFLVLVIGKKIMEKRDIYHIVYKDVSVSGLQLGGAVKYHGINVGRIDDISIDAQDVSKIIVTISMRAGTPIKTDVRATLVPIGITGLKQIELVGGSNKADLLKPGSEIPAGKSSLENITGKAEVVAEKLETVLNNLAQLTGEENRKRINSILANVDSIIAQNKLPAKNIMTNLDTTSYYVVELLESASLAMKKINSVLDSDQLHNILANSDKISSDIAAADLKKLFADLNVTITQANETINHIDLTVLKSRQDILVTIETLKEAVDYLNEFSRQISENPAILLRMKKQE
jgi:phospholipid/cholesterol/gamma-HCH transport system substrate-binding protein